MLYYHTLLVLFGGISHADRECYSHCFSRTTWPQLAEWPSLTSVPPSSSNKINYYSMHLFRNISEPKLATFLMSVFMLLEVKRVIFFHLRGREKKAGFVLLSLCFKKLPWSVVLSLLFWARLSAPLLVPFPLCSLALANNIMALCLSSPCQEY